MKEYRKRIIDDLLELNMEAFGATWIRGPKGCGKTTTAKQKAKSVVEFQDEEMRDNLLKIADLLEVDIKELIVREYKAYMEKVNSAIGLY